MVESKNSVTVIEENMRLSQSCIWQIQRNFFKQLGEKAWSNNIVPSFITSNTYIAQSYARVIFAWLRDISQDLDKSQPVYIVELGAGSGRLAYHFMKAFFDFFDNSVLNDISITYVLTDFTQATLDFWQNHPQLKSWVQKGRLDFALFDAETDKTFELIHSGKTLSSKTMINPMAVIANYFFDGLTQDIFSIENGELKESLVTLTSSEPNPDLTDLSLLERIEINSEQHEMNADYYDDPLFNQILDEYRNVLTQTHLLFPVGGLNCLRRLLNMSKGQLFLLTADKGYHRETDLLYRNKPALAVHGSFSMMVNYHAIGQYAQLRGGHFLSTPHQHGNLAICAAVLGDSSEDYPETQQAFYLEIVQRSPDDFYTMNKDIEVHYENMSLEGMLAYLRLCGWDSTVFFRFFPFILLRLGDISASEREEIFWAVKAIWRNYYFIGETLDIPFTIGRLLYTLSYYAEAIEYWEHSLRLHGDDTRTYHNLAACHYELRQLPEALDYVKQSLEVDSQYEPARALRIKIQSELKRSKRK